MKQRKRKIEKDEVINSSFKFTFQSTESKEDLELKI